MKLNWQKQLFWGIRIGHLAVVLAFYFFFCLLYVITLAYNESAYVKMTFSELVFYYLKRNSIDYILKLALTIPIWYLHFIVIKNWSIYRKVIIHLFTLILYVFLWKATYYFIMESIGYNHLKGTSQVWDIYIPTLIYIIQFGIFHAYEYYRQVQHQKEVESQLRQITLQSELSAIKAQLNPHFLFNVFNTISASVPPKMESTREMIAKLADMFRYQLQASKSELVPLKDELDFVEKYLTLEKMRFGNRLTINMEVDSSLFLEKIPPMLIQPIVENAIKHGLSSLIDGGEIGIKINKLGQKIKVEVSDTGIGMIDKNNFMNKGTGLTNTQYRLEKMYNSNLKLSDNLPKGLIVCFEI